MRCIFCQELLHGRESTEHILLNAFGGKVTTRKLSCAPCNNRFGRTIDREFAEQFAFVRNLFEMVSGDGKDAPSLLKVQAGDRRINLRGDGDISLVGKPFTAEKIGDGRFRVEINVSNLEDLETIIPHIAAKTGITESRLREQLANEPFTETQERPGVINLASSFGGEGALRAAAKACMLLWARKLGNAEVQKPVYDQIRRFIENGSADFLTDRWSLDSRSLPESSEIEAAYGPLFNMVYVASDTSGRVTGHFTAYNLTGFQVVLAEDGGAVEQTAGLVNNPLDPRIWSDQAHKTHLLSPEWLAQPSRDTTNYRARFGHMNKAYHQIMGQRAVRRIIQRVFDSRGLGDDTPIPPELLEPIARPRGQSLT